MWVACGEAPCASPCTHQAHTMHTPCTHHAHTKAPALAHAHHALHRLRAAERVTRSLQLACRLAVTGAPLGLLLPLEHGEHLCVHPVAAVQLRHL